ncbi:hypothetical protein Bccel_2153 [Pseudobacteroides cellulosolvens ATCC 35603 = DSM 2933]|uniref:MORN repeat-containing protein n=1 Tax=Pseudobacteroides cellulosolvens ATCC 35603 = DSM 2933 TaxID=398512 RepID=A0A0L6JMA7_9FIRM|nr:hypothetical protein Bccel_2153 [Pseudobacteroides cellulosolvens ATCC 35603 = DSM 2933]
MLFSPHINAISKYYKLINQLQWYWNWSGKCIGYFDKGFLWNSDGKIIGKFIDNEIYSSEGNYIGESYKGNNRLCIDKSKIGKKIEPFEMTQISYKIGNDESICTLKIYNQLEDFTVTD